MTQSDDKYEPVPGIRDTIDCLRMENIELKRENDSLKLRYKELEEQTGQTGARLLAEKEKYDELLVLFTAVSGRNVSLACENIELKYENNLKRKGIE